MRELEYPFDPGYIMKKRRSIKKELLKTDKPFIEKRIAVLGGSTTHDIIDILETFSAELWNQTDVLRVGVQSVLAGRDVRQSEA